MYLHIVLKYYEFVALVLADSTRLYLSMHGVVHVAASAASNNLGGSLSSLWSEKHGA